MAGQGGPVRMRIRGVEKINKKIKKLNKRATDASIAKNTSRIFGRANFIHTPFDTGYLQRSFYVYPSRKQIRLGWLADYAKRVNTIGRSKGFAQKVAREGLKDLRAYGRTGKPPKHARAPRRK